MSWIGGRWMMHHYLAIYLLFLYTFEKIKLYECMVWKRSQWKKKIEFCQILGIVRAKDISLLTFCAHNCNCSNMYHIDIYIEYMHFYNLLYFLYECHCIIDFSLCIFLKIRVFILSWFWKWEIVKFIYSPVYLLILLYELL